MSACVYRLYLAMLMALDMSSVIYLLTFIYINAI